MRIDLRKFVLLSAFVMILASCQGTTAITPEDSVLITPTKPAVQSTVESRLTSTPRTAVTTTSLANCTVVSQQPTPGPTEQSLFPPVSAADWVQGAPSATVTFVEYSDFQ